MKIHDVRTSWLVECACVCNIVWYPYRVVDICHLQQVLGAPVLLHLYGLSAPLHGHTVAFGEVGERRQISALENDLVDVILIFPEKNSLKKCNIHICFTFFPKFV